MELVRNINYNVFELFDEIDSLFTEAKLIEISVRQSQLSLIFENDLIPLSDLQNDILIDSSDHSYLAMMEENPVIVLPFKNNKEHYVGKNPFYNLNSLIFLISEKVCKCPALEIVFSNQYLKCYLDKPGLRISDLEEYEKIFELEGTLELHGQRPYLLFINENFSVGGELFARD